SVALAAVTAAVVGGVVLFGGSDVPEAATTTAAPVTSTRLTTTTSTTTTTTTTVVPRVILHAEGAPADLEAAIFALYSWMADPAALPPPLPDGMASFLEAARGDETVELTASVYQDELADGTGVAVAKVGKDVILAVAAGSAWEIVGAKLSSFDIGAWYGDPIRHILVIGTDARPHESQPDLRADSIHIVAASLDAGGGGIVGFPRDSYVDASYGFDKFSSVNVRAGREEMVRIAEDLSGIEMDGYILTGFAGFKNLVNHFGGVEVDVPFRMSDDDANAYLDAGLQVLKGGDALAFSRNRHIAGGDFTRSFHQGVVMKAGLAGTQARSIGKLPGLLAVLSTYTWTDLSAAELLQLGAIAYELDPEMVGNVVLPGAVGSANGASVVRLTSGADAVFEDLVDGVVTGD
ncbi:MAG: LCP family protein, partial [Actinomycetota bacterium]